ncbi:hypothetical protein Lesp02_05450 [Lentzea sp. NBRC 105346]|uniref:hypothetical protein n=1 Tax=Lentzea sp. NBRC 105346 TaxID=3032205 RepID=UPI0024A39B45|nr:hypothetical protein [Lentzea sp. NBRC 105346]GLZ28355.1 hypothetical protein Lesp02_05450 [Lentzea sp. NBRC 105346]
MTARTLDREFADLVLTDPELLRAEFDDIVAGWDDVPPIPAPRPAPPGGAGLPPVRGMPWPPEILGVTWGARQRSPPRRVPLRDAACRSETVPVR